MSYKAEAEQTHLASRGGESPLLAKTERLTSGKHGDELLEGV
jgi:hypothetical protein